MESKIKIKKEQIEDYAVQKTGDQAINGIKTFEVSPIVPEATENNQVVNLGQVQDIADLKPDYSEVVLQSEKGTMSGVATLDGNGKIPLSQINDALLGNVNYQGIYNPSTNTPDLDIVIPKGHYYIVGTAGTRHGISFEIGDWIISNGTSYNKVDNTDAVSSVAGLSGVISTANLKTALDNVTNLSIQNNLGIEQFKVTDKLLFKGASFNNQTKEISVNALQINTAYVDGINGNDSTAEFGNANKPYKTIDAVYLGMVDDIDKTTKIEIIKKGTYKINNKIPVGQNIISSLLPVVLDLSTNENQYLFTYNNGSLLNASFIFDIPNGTIQNLRSGGTGVSMAQNQTTFTLNVKAINWQCSSYIFYATDVIFSRIQTLNTLARITQGTGIQCKQGLKVDTLTIPSSAIDDIFTGISGIIDINNLICDSTKLQLTASYFRIGNISGSGAIAFTYHAANTIIEFVNSTISIPLKFSQTIGNLTFQGSIKSCSFDTTTQGSTGILNLKNLIIETITSGFIKFYNTATINIINSTIKTPGVLIQKTSAGGGNQLKVNITNSAIEQVTRTFLIECETASTVALKLSGLETNALSLGNSNAILVNYALLSFKDKTNEIIIRSRVDIVNKALDSSMNYIIDGIITLLPTDFIEVPVGGLSLSGYGFDVSAIKATTAGSTIFKSPVGGCGNLFLSNISIEASGTGSKVFDLTNAGTPTGGADAIELNVVNFENCESLGSLTNFRQGLWNNVGIFGVKDGLTFNGTWSGGFRSDLTIVRNFGTASTNSVLFKAGTDLLFKSRFWSDLNADFKEGGAISNFIPSNFNTNKLYQLRGTQITRNNVIDTTQNYTSTITAYDDVSDWTNNNGLLNSKIIVPSDIEITDSSQGVILTSPDSTRWKITISDIGVLTATAV